MKATKEQIIAEANRRRAEHGKGAPPVEHFIIEVMRENWTPPEPVDPDILAFREWAASDCEAIGWTGGAPLHRLGHFDRSERAEAYLAGARMAREQERERAKMLLECLDNIQQFSRWVDGQHAARALAKYRGEA